MTDTVKHASAIRSLLRVTDVHSFEYLDSDRELFDRFLRDFVPPESFDAHAHLYDLRHLIPSAKADSLPRCSAVDHESLVASMRQWMGDHVVQEGLYFPLPTAQLDCTAANRFLAASLRGRNRCRGLMMIRPDDEPADVEAQLLESNFAGFKVYHVFAEREETFHATQGEFLPEWAWELADRYSLVIMMHMVLPRALSDPSNQAYIRDHCRQYPAAKLILAHAARGFNARHTVDAAGVLRGLDNVWCDTSAVCEPAAFEAILAACGPTRLLYGSDFPVSELRGRSVSVGDGFFWMYDHNVEWSGWKHATPQLVGIESLLALQQACRTMKLIDRDIEKIFGDNARQILGLSQPRDDVGEMYCEAKKIIPGGTQLLSKRPEMFAPDRWPAYYEQAIGCEVVDVDGRRYIDMSHCGILSCILGFADPDVNAAVIRRVHLGVMATQQTADEVELARLLVDIHPWAQQARFARGGGDAMAIAIRIARAATGRSQAAVCGYHGWHDWYLAANISLPDADDASRRSSLATSTRQLDAHLLPGLDPIGVPRELAGTVATFRYNRLDDLDAILRVGADQLAAIVMEPTRGVDPNAGFLEGVRERADRFGIPLIFDEISSGFRLCLGGAHRLFGVDPDIAVFAKALSNGFAMGAVIGRETVMQACQESFISSTSWTEGVGPAAAVATVRKMMRIDVPAHLREIGSKVMEGWRTLARKHRLSLLIAGRPASCSLSFEHPQNAELLTLMTSRMLDHGFLAASQCSLTLAHDTHHVNQYLDALDEVLGELSGAIAAGDISERLATPTKHSSFRRLVD